MRVAFQGEPGAYSEAAAIRHFGAGVETIPCETFDDLFARVTEGAADYAMAPIENSLAGSIHQNYDLLARHDLHIVGETVLRVEHCLIVGNGVTLDEIQIVMSHPQALAQCDHFIKARGWKREVVYDTAGSVKLLKASGKRDAAAIASERAADVYGMKALLRNIEDNPQNFTRFLVLGREPVEPREPCKTSIVFTLHNIPGALFKALSVFALRDIDLTKIESRPIPGAPWEYMFYLDFAESVYNERGKRALMHLSEIASYLRVFGSYPRAEISATESDAVESVATPKENVWNLNIRG
ncbi:MAG TPA: prephenate dehydratase [Anaerolineae bacterium]|nr:prephenate dehydratase [Anaerolineae bacterium]